MDVYKDNYLKVVLKTLKLLYLNFYYKNNGDYIGTAGTVTAKLWPI